MLCAVAGDSTSYVYRMLVHFLRAERATALRCLGRRWHWRLQSYHGEPLSSTHTQVADQLPHNVNCHDMFLNCPVPSRAGLLLTHPPRMMQCAPSAVRRNAPQSLPRAPYPAGAAPLSPPCPALPRPAPGLARHDGSHHPSIFTTPLHFFCSTAITTITIITGFMPPRPLGPSARPAQPLIRTVPPPARPRPWAPLPPSGWP